MTDLALPPPSFCALARGCPIPAGTQIIGWYHTRGAPEISSGILRRTSVTLVPGGDRYVAHMAPWLPVVAASCSGARPALWIAPETSCAICGTMCDPAAGLRGFDDHNYICNDCGDTNEVYVATIDGAWCLRDECCYNVDTQEWASYTDASNNWYLWEADEQYHSNPEDADEEEEDVESACGPIFEYHTDALNYVTYDRAAIRAGKLLYGVELEMEATTVSNRELAEALGGPSTDDYILTHDGSLHNGIELVSAPRTLKAHQTSDLWKNVSAIARPIAESGSGTARCGMHVHINRRALTPLVLGKMLLFFNDNRMDGYITCIAQRDSNGYSRKKDKRLIDALDPNEDRYERLNFSRRTSTVEVRIFRGNLRLERILKNIEFVDAAVNYCKQCSVRDASDWATFAQWLRPQTSIYPHLIAFLKERHVWGFTGWKLPRSIMALAAEAQEA